MTDDDNDDNLLHAFDLGAWGAPPPPANLADGVLARVAAADAAIAAMKQRGSKRRWWAIGGVAAGVAAAALAVWLGVRTPDEPAPQLGSGTVVADRAQRIDLGASWANADPGARVGWRRDGSVLHVTQEAGAATWNVGSKDQLVLATAGASVEAAGGSLRVEVRMNATDVRVIGASAATAAAVAMVTVIVYEGHVKVTSGQQTMVVVPGTTVEVATGKPPREVSNVGIAPNVNIASQVTHAVVTAQRDLEGCFAEWADRPAIGSRRATDSDVEVTLSVTPDGAGIAAIARGVDTDRSPSLKLCVEGALARVKYPPNPETLELQVSVAWAAPDMINTSARIVGHHETPTRPIVDSSTGVDLVVPVGESATIHDPHGAATVQIGATCTGKLVTTVPYGTFEHEQTFRFEAREYPFIAREYRYSLTCDGAPIGGGVIAVMRDPGTAQLPDPIAAIAEPIDGTVWAMPVHVTGKAAIGASVSVSGRGILVDSADHGFAGDLDLGSATTLAIRVEHPQRGIHYFLRRNGASADKTVVGRCDEVSCVLNNYEGPCCAKYAGATKPAPTTQQKTPPACDQAALLKVAEGSVALGNHGQALRHYEAALRCKSDPHTLQLVFMEACNSANVSKATLYWKQLTPEEQPRMLPICTRNKISRAQLDGAPAAAPAAAPATCDPKPLIDKARDSMSVGASAQALTLYEAALKCQRDPNTLQLAFMAACNAGNVPKAKVYWKKLPADAQNRALQICVRNRITRDQLDGP